MAFEGLVACICEGGAERTIIEILLENDLLKFSKEQLLDGEILGKRDRSAKNFEKNHLRKRFDEKITIVRVLDSRREEFLLSKLYRDKIEVINYITAPEIEMLIILKENKNKEFQKVKSKTKASEFCENVLGIKDVKSPQFIKNYFENTEVLINVLNQYKSIKAIPHGEYCLADLLKNTNTQRYEETRRFWLDGLHIIDNPITPHRNGTKLFELLSDRDEIKLIDGQAVYIEANSISLI